VSHLWLPLTLMLLASALLMSGGVDQRIADAVYHAEGNHWLLKNYWLTAELIHRGGKWLSASAAVLVFVAAVVAWMNPLHRRWRWPLTMLGVSIALSTALVSQLKRATGMDCPWDLGRYGGRLPYYGLFESRHGLPATGCFPAGHASAGYAWLALYFFALATRPNLRWPALGVGLVAGGVLGIAQQLRGAHFLSHDLWTLAICWIVPLLLFRLPVARPLAQVQS
jgi:membrane-associated PAP2 superfamily phosphatase